jgi:hypothetical protein
MTTQHEGIEGTLSVEQRPVGRRKGVLTPVGVPVAAPQARSKGGRTIAGGRPRVARRGSAAASMLVPPGPLDVPHRAPST